MGAKQKKKNRTSELELAGILLSFMLLVVAVLHLVVIINISKERAEVAQKYALERKVYIDRGVEVPADLWIDPDTMVEGTEMSRSPMAAILLWMAGLAGALYGSYHNRWWYAFFIFSAVIIMFCLGFYCISNCEANPGLSGQVKSIVSFIKGIG